MVWRIIGTLALAALLVFGYYYIKNYREAEKEAEYRHYATVITETSLAAELYRHSPDSFLIVRDSILRKNNVTLEEMRNLAEKYKGSIEKTADLWKMVSEMTDSVATIEDSLLKEKASLAADSVGKDSL
ncbi:hypothetical protein TRIP_C90239 [Candidatus Zixiibacteriota bacterium]|nr:hypothetical protein TRIP_C90239 [candidate division Zixibacteria bacterium]